jgi:hypothetical protein
MPGSKALKSLLAQLAVFNVAGRCPRYSIRDAYRLMLEPHLSERACLQRAAGRLDSALHDA